MQSRGQVFKLLSKRYGWGYAEINKLNQVYLTSCYLPNHPEIKDANMPKLTGSLTEDSFFRITLGMDGSDSGLGITHLQGSSPRQFSQEQIEEIIRELDTRFRPIFLEEDALKEEKNHMAIFSKNQVGIKKPITNNQVLWCAALGVKSITQSSQYSLIFDFKSLQHLEIFLGYVPEKDKESAKSEIYVTYQCSYRQKGCYQILIPYGCELKALTLLLKQNPYISEAPITDFLLEQVKPKSFLASAFSSSLTDAQYSTALTILQKFIEKDGKAELTDFDFASKKMIESHTGLKQIFSDTTKYFKINETVRSFFDFIPTELTNVISDYQGGLPRFKT